MPVVGQGPESRQHLQAVVDCRLDQHQQPLILMNSKIVPECVMFKRAPVAFLCTRMSFDFANLVSGPNAPDRAILALLSSCVARFVMHPTALHWTSTLSEDIWRIKGARPPSWTMETLFSAGQVNQHPVAEQP